MNYYFTYFLISKIYLLDLLLSKESTGRGRSRGRVTGRGKCKHFLKMLYTLVSKTQYCTCHETHNII